MDALLDHLNTQHDLIRDLQERVEFIEKGYRPRQSEAETKAILNGACPRASSKKAFAAAEAGATLNGARPRTPSKRVIAAAEVLLEKVVVGATLGALAERLDMSPSSAGRTFMALQKALPGLIKSGKASHCRTFCLPKESEAPVRAWLSKHTAKAHEAFPEPINGVAVLAMTEGCFTLTLPTGGVHRATRARALKRKAKLLGYSVDDQTVATERVQTSLGHDSPVA
jgi:hypothetical protein